MNRRALLKSALGIVTFGLLAKKLPAVEPCRHDFPPSLMKCSKCGISFEEALEAALRNHKWIAPVACP